MILDFPDNAHTVYGGLDTGDSVARAHALIREAGAYIVTDSIHGYADIFKNAGDCLRLSAVKTI